MGQVGGHQATVEKLYALYKEKGFLREEEALAVMTADGVSLVGINRVTDKLIALGVIFADDSLAEDEEETDRAQTDYEALFIEVLEISPGQQILIDYIRNVRPPQNREWRPLITQMNSGNEYAFNRLFDMYLRVVVKIALRISKENDFELDDAIQEGSMGLIRAIRQYDGSKHGNLGSYLPLWIQQYIGKAVADKGRTIRLPVYAYEIVVRLNQSRRTLEDRLGREPSYAEIAAEASTSVETAIKLLEATQEPVSLDALFEGETDEEYIFKHFSIPSFEEKSDNNFLAELVRTTLQTLPDREAKVLSLRFGLYDGQERTLEEVGAVFNVTRERVRQIEAKALRRLRNPRLARQIDLY
jgi:RNA polymerase primary sigma factor